MPAPPSLGAPVPSKVTIKHRGRLQVSHAMQQAAQKMKRSRVTVGVHEDAGTYEAEDGTPPVPVAKVAFWIENGTRYMPARPFFYPALAANERGIKQIIADAAARVLHGGEEIEQALGRVGFAVQSWVQNVIKSNVGPGLGGTKGSKAYLARRQERFPESGSRTLIASGLLLRSVRYKVVVDGAAPVEGPVEGPTANDPVPGKSHEHPNGADVGGAIGRAAARQAAADHKREQKRQKKYAKDNPEAQKQAFNRQRRAYQPFNPKRVP